MFRSFLTLCLIAGATGAFAQPRPYTERLSCQGASGLVASRGAVVLQTSPTTYDRYVRARNFCTPTEITRPAFVATVNNPQCFIGYTCEEYHRDQFPF